MNMHNIYTFFKSVREKIKVHGKYYKHQISEKENCTYDNVGNGETN